MRRTRARAAWVAAPVPAGGSSVSIMVALQIICVSPPLLRCPQVHKASFSMLLLAAADAGGMGEVDHGWSRTHRHLLQPGLHHKAAALTGHHRRVQLSKRRGTTGLGEGAPPPARSSFWRTVTRRSLQRLDDIIARVRTQRFAHAAAAAGPA